MTFKTFCKQFLNDDNDVSDFAYDLQFDKKFPKTKIRLKALVYLKLLNVPSECLKAFNKAWTSYEKYLKEERQKKTIDNLKD